MGIMRVSAHDHSNASNFLPVNDKCSILLNDTIRPI